MNSEMRLKVESKILGIIAEIADEPLEENTPKDIDLMVSGHLDSFGFVQLLMHLEKAFDIEIDEEAQLDPRLRNVSGMVDFVTSS